MHDTAERKVTRRPDGDLTIEGTSVWMPADPKKLAQERAEVMQRLADLTRAELFIASTPTPTYMHRGDYYREG
ncbi:hypothetical protein SEA_DUNCANSLEG_45 [Mycobacterium phage DuncansLeg]|nr:hypothetical protein SEA_DUNCANSLEG_45 [Mycobacterium phage DuncansLeg]